MTVLTRTFDEYKQAVDSLNKDIVGISMHEKGYGDLHPGHELVVKEAQRLLPNHATAITIWEPYWMDEFFELGGFITSKCDTAYVLDWAQSLNVDIVQFYNTEEIKKAWDTENPRDYLKLAESIVAEQGYVHDAIYDLKFIIMTCMMMKNKFDWFNRTRMTHKIFSKKDGWHVYNYVHFLETYCGVQGILIDPIYDGEIPYSTTWKYLDWTAEDRQNFEKAAKALKGKVGKDLDKINFDKRASKDKLKYIETKIYDDPKIAPDEIILEHFLTFSAKYPNGAARIPEIIKR